MLKTILNFLKRILKHRQTLWLMIERDFRNRYVGSMMGVLWSILHPLLMVAIYSVIFSLVFGRHVGNTPFSLWLFTALLPWLMFSETLKSSLNVIERNKNVVTKTPLNAEILPLVVIGTTVTGHVIGLAVLIVLLLVFQQPLGLFALTVPFYLICMTLFALGLSWAVASLNVFMRDVGQTVNVILQFWFYCCPILYPMHIIPDRYRFLLRFNPMVFITEGYRRALLSNQGILWVDFLFFGGSCLLALVIGGWIFKKLKPQFAEVL